MFIQENIVLVTAFVVWTLVWKGIALWKAARLSHKNWFIAILVLNTAGILDIIYLYVITRGYEVVTVEETEK